MGRIKVEHYSAEEIRHPSKKMHLLFYMRMRIYELVRINIKYKKKEQFGELYSIMIYILDLII